MDGFKPLETEVSNIRNAQGGRSFSRRLRCSLLTDRWRICSSFAPRLHEKSLAANVQLFRGHYTSTTALKDPNQTNRHTPPHEPRSGQTVAKRQRTGAVQDAEALSRGPRPRASVVECASPLALCLAVQGFHARIISANSHPGPLPDWVHGEGCGHCLGTKCRCSVSNSASVTVPFAPTI